MSPQMPVMIEDPRALAKILRTAPVRSHVVEFYDNTMSLAERVADFAKRGLRSREGVILIATPEHLGLFRTMLRGSGLPIQVLEASSGLKCTAVESALSTFTNHDQVSWTRIESNIGTMISAVSARWGKVRVYGEMVNVLWQQGLTREALKLEVFWNRLSMMYPFCLFCSYALETLDQAALSSIARTHSQSFCSGDSPLLIH